jgi:hypothetical protein
LVDNDDIESRVPSRRSTPQKMLEEDEQVNTKQQDTQSEHID